LENLEEKDHLGDLSVNGRIKLTCILKKYDPRIWNMIMNLRVAYRMGNFLTPE
jgi:hypothetical protein